MDMDKYTHTNKNKHKNTHTHTPLLHCNMDMKSDLRVGTIKSPQRILEDLHEIAWKRDVGWRQLVSSLYDQIMSQIIEWSDY